MANISFNKLGLKLNEEKKILKWNEQDIEITQYLPVQEKLGVMQDVIMSSMTEYNYENPVQVEVYTYLSIIKNYTNIKFTEKQLESPAKLYDLIRSSGLLDEIINNIPAEEYDELTAGIKKSLTAFYAYRNSVLGILDVLKTDYSNLNLDIEKIVSQVKDPEALGILRDLIPFVQG